jgi:iron complex outermembrane recepter protein
MIISLAGMFCLLNSTVFAESSDENKAAPSAAASTSGSETSSNDGLKEIVVTAERRAENPQKIALSVTALDGQELADKEVRNLDDLQLVSPSLSITNSGLFQFVNIRGIGLSNANPNVTTGVAEYIDGLFQAPIATANTFYDLAGVEVLRGPQGTLVGTNSTGGAIYIKSNSPELNKADGYFQAEYGTYNSYEAQGAINLPLADDLALRAAGFYRGHDSYYTDVGPYHNDAGMLSERGGRVGVLWRPGSFEALLKVQINDRETGGYPYQPVPGTAFAPYKVGGPFTLDYDSPTANRDQLLIVNLELRQELADGIVIRSVSGYQHQQVNNLIDLDATQAPASVGGESSEIYYAGGKTYSQEFNIISPSTGPFSWIAGSYFQRDNVVVSIDEMEAGFPSLITPNQERTTYGFFAQGDYHITDAVEFQLGGRYSEYRASGGGGVVVGTGVPGFPPDGLLVADLSGEHRDSRPTGKAALNWQLNESNMVYAMAARGYKPGGFNSLTSQFDPETVNSYEIGWKPSFMDNRVRAQVDAFFNNYNNFQYQILDTTTGESGIQNIANMKTKGLEAQVQGKFGGFGLDGNVAYLDSQVPTFLSVNTRPLPSGNLGPQCPPGVPAQPPVCFDYGPYAQQQGGGANSYAPRWTYNAGINYDIDAGNSMTLTPRVNYAYIGPQFTYLGYSPVSDRIAGYGLLSAKLTLNLPKWWVELYGTNLTNRAYIAGQQTITVNTEIYGDPRLGGIRGGFRF